MVLYVLLAFVFVTRLRQRATIQYKVYKSIPQRVLPNSKGNNFYSLSVDKQLTSGVRSIE